MSESAIFSRNGLLLSRDVYTSAPEYTAGPFIDITDHVISGYDWTHMIESGMSSVEPDLSDYYQKNETSSKEELSAAFDNCCTGCSAYSGGQNIDITEHIVSVTGRKRLKVERPITLTKDTTSFTLGCDLEGLVPAQTSDVWKSLASGDFCTNSNAIYKISAVNFVDGKHYNKVRGFVDVYADTAIMTAYNLNGGAVSIMPLDDDDVINQTWDKGTGNYNVYGVSGYASIPFYFDKEYGIANIGIKGTQYYDNDVSGYRSPVSILHAYVEGSEPVDDTPIV